MIDHYVHTARWEQAEFDRLKASTGARKARIETAIETELAEAGVAGWPGAGRDASRNSCTSGSSSPPGTASQTSSTSRA